MFGLVRTVSAYSKFPKILRLLTAVWLFVSVLPCQAQFEVDPGTLRSGRLAFSVAGTGASTIFVADFDRQKSYSIISDQQAFHEEPDWSMDGKSLLYSAGDSPAQRHIFLFDGERSRQLTTGAQFDQDPQWFSGSDLISFIRSGKGRTRTIWTMQSNGEKLQLGYAAKAESFSARPSPKLTELLVVTDTDWPGRDILLIPFDTEKPRLVTIGSVNHDDPAWNPDGQRFAVTAGRSPETEIAIIAVKRDEEGQSPLEYVTREAGTERNPEWHDDGKRIFYIKDLTESGSEVRLIDTGSKDQKVIIRSKQRIRNLTWTPTAGMNAPRGDYFVVSKEAPKAAR